MNATISINPARSNLAKLWTAWQVISVVLLTGYSVVFFTSLGSTPKERSIYLALALLMPVIGVIAWVVAFICYKQRRYIIACFSAIWGLILFLIVSVSGAFQMMISWGLLQ
jgi:hypothetical protein